MITQLYDTLHVREHHADMEKRILAQLEEVKLELDPLEQVNLKFVEYQIKYQNTISILYRVATSWLQVRKFNRK